MFMGQNHMYRPNNPKRNPWGGVVGLEKAPKPVVTQTELSRDVKSAASSLSSLLVIDGPILTGCAACLQNPVPEPARKRDEAHGGYAGAPGGSLSHRDAPHPPAYPNPSRGAYSARGVRPLRNPPGVRAVWIFF